MNNNPGRSDSRTDKVWYACYGSNLSRKRFLCYIKGGTPDFADREYPGCTDRTPPQDERNILIPHRLYFAHQSEIWGNAGVAFLDHERDHDMITLGRMYLISSEQFVQVFRQENGEAPENSDLCPDIVAVIEKCIQDGSADPGQGSDWYSRLLLLGMIDRVPILTFTSGTIFNDNPPGEKYLMTIRYGLRECYPDMNDRELDEYLEGRVKSR